jgi:hypothetical protein
MITVLSDVTPCSLAQKHQVYRDICHMWRPQTLTPLTTWHHIPEDSTHSHHCENHISHIKDSTQKFQQSKAQGGRGERERGEKKKKSSDVSLNIIHTVLQCPQKLATVNSLSFQPVTMYCLSCSATHSSAAPHMPWLRWLAAAPPLPVERPGFKPNPVHVGFLVEK